MSTYLYRLARFCYRRRRGVVAFWLLLMVAAVGLGIGSGGKTVDDFTVPGTASQKALDLLKERAPVAAGAQSQAVFAVSTGRVTDPANRQNIEAALAAMKESPQVAKIVDPFQTKAVSPDGQVAAAAIIYGAETAMVEESSVKAVDRAADRARSAGVQTEFTGQVYPGSVMKVSELPEIIGVCVALIILLITFGARAAAATPLLSALVGVVISLMGVMALSAVIDVSSASTSLTIMLSLACGIDYALFILARHRNNMLTGMTVEESIALAVGTSGSSVVFAGLTVIIALCGLSVVGIPFLTTMGLVAAAGLLITVLIALTFLPAMLGFVGERVVKFVHPIIDGDRPERVARTTVEHPQQIVGSRWARGVVRFRVPVLVLGVVMLGVIALPAASMQLGIPGSNSKPPSTTGHKAYDLLAKGFGVGYNAPLLVVADLSDAAGPQELQQLTGTLAKTPGIAGASISVPPTNNVAVINAIPTTGPDSQETKSTVNRIRDESSRIKRETGITIGVGGQVASDIDTSQRLSSAVPVFLLVVVGLAVVLLTFAFRSIFVPIKSVIGFLLSIGVSLGALVAVFQWGWLAGLFGVQPGPIVSFLPVVTLAIIFGLSSDYEVFVVSRIKEEFSRSHDARGSVERGLGASVRIISAAALIMFGVFASFVVPSDPTIKAIGFALAVGVLADAFAVRLTLVPAVMAMARDKIWYRPRWFAKYVPDADIEGERLNRRVPDKSVA